MGSRERRVERRTGRRGGGGGGEGREGVGVGGEDGGVERSLGGGLLGSHWSKLENEEEYIGTRLGNEGRKEGRKSGVRGGEV